MTRNLFKKRNAWIAILVLTVVFPVGVVCQITPPVPKAESEIRDNSIKMRSNSLELMKREAQRRDESPVVYNKAKFAAVKKDFENVQRFQDLIIRVYKTGKRIDYQRIGGLAGKMNAAAMRLNKNLFGQKERPKVKTVSVKRRDTAKTIVSLDKAIGKFVGSEVFGNKGVVDSKASRKAQKRLVRVIVLSGRLETVRSSGSK